MPSLESGKRLADRYLLQERLGDGGHAEVWAAFDEQAARRVALKFLHAQVGDADDAWRVLRHEAQMAQRLDHPGVLQLEVPQRAGQTVFLPMQYASGGDATALRGADWQQLLPVLIDVAKILEHAHSRGVVHRDIKPGNVLFDESRAVLLTDFGTAARTGSTAALSTGSPFSASPQQLQGEAATTADDVYGLGALAYELLSGYPPYYPDFNARRVQVEMPLPLSPVHPAPAALVALVTAMLARTAAARPDMRQVLQVFVRCRMAEAAASGFAGARVVEPLPPEEVAPAGHGLRRNGMPPALWLGVAAGVAVAAFVLLPRWLAQPPTTVGVAKAVDTLPSIVSDKSLLAEQQVLADAAARTEHVQQELASGRAALVAGQAAVARSAFQRALGLDAASDEAARGLAATARLEDVLQRYLAAARVEARGDLSGAQAQYAAIVQQDAAFAPAQAALVRVQRANNDRQLEGLVAAGVAALLAGRIDAAQAAYQRAAALQPGDARVRDGLARVDEIRRDQQNARDMAAGSSLEREERWSEAVTYYRGVTTRDATLLFAQEGLVRSSRRADLDQELEGYLARPDRLIAAAVRAAAGRAIARSEATAPRGARLAAQQQRLLQALTALEAQVRVAISSDNSTHISITKVGDLGVFTLREVELPPGNYIVTGTRDGFRDVRQELSVVPGQQGAVLSVLCSERI